MEKSGGDIKINSISEKLGIFMRKCIYSVLSVGPIPNHIAFIMDGNRRYAKGRNMGEGAGHNVGFLALMSVLRFCYELGVKYVTVYAFSIDNFKRRPEEVETLMDLMLEKIEGLMKEESFVNRYGVRVHFAGNLMLLSEPVREAAKKAMEATAANSKAVLSICVAYTSTDEIANAVQQSCKEKYEKRAGHGSNGLGGNEEYYYHGQNSIKVVDIDKHMYMAVAPDPDILIRTSGETRLSNFLLWQSAYSYIYSPSALWPEIGFRHLVWAILNFQSNHFYLEKKKKQN
ncbi:dehydrodolichyl diphosphate synthase CPT3-like [Cornus florida]|uniref:dehydrodolichyl diphosphate synthase CPT3-like n=1 Tax=Cornus florida TaxID=4283 RepID=UPI00289E68BD|nr:dehydrodolichyl diphosphate synthase CPT3-like [Cornus florida]XP_059654152.1 dehydrodolichyl diphosphate synthase CPT3-like [Cornus florida]XP_059654153.1 dehydrodolichyl diphosphate synthase CPT3-like [Cornus florida]